jgi:hypothetical protein
MPVRNGEYESDCGWADAPTVAVVGSSSYNGGVFHKLWVELKMLGCRHGTAYSAHVSTACRLAAICTIMHQFHQQCGPKA